MSKARLIPEDDLDRPVWGAKAIAQLINRTERQTFHLLARGLIEATKVGPLYTTTKRRLNRSLGVHASPAGRDVDAG